MKGNSPDPFDAVSNVEVGRGERDKNAAEFCSSVPGCLNYSMQTQRKQNNDTFG